MSNVQGEVGKNLGSVERPVLRPVLRSFSAGGSFSEGGSETIIENGQIPLTAIAKKLIKTLE
jgi:hypothetical protein